MMNEMDGSMRSGGVIKKKSSSGCLIIKKKADVLGSGVVGSSDESLEPVRRKFDDRMKNGDPVVYSRRVVEEGREFRRNGETNVENDRKRSRLKLFEFDEYDEFDGKRMRNDFMGMVGGSGGNLREFAGGGSGRNVMGEKRKHRAYFNGSGSGLSRRNKTVAVSGKNRHGLEDEYDEANLPISSLRLKYQEESAEPIRLQGKNGVLKVMVNKKKKMELSSCKSFDRQVVDNNRKESSYEEAVKEETPLQPAFHSDSKRAEKPIAFMEKEKSRMKLQKQILGKPNKPGDSEREKSEQKLQKQLIRKRCRDGDHESDATDTSPSLDTGGAAAKAVKRETKRSLPSENVSPIKGRERTVTPQADNLTPVKDKDTKLKRGGSTEKQLLRERIREMLLSAGWTIDYRPRRNRDYLDAVYINSSGTAYWSIIKAYDALQKQWPGDDDKSRAHGISSSFSPLSGELINKLTRRTRKKMEEEMKRKSKDVAVTKKSKKGLAEDSAEDSDSDHNEEKLSSFVRQNGKSKKGRFRKSNREDGDDLSDDSCGEDPEQEENAARHSKSKSNAVQARKSRKIGRCTLLVRSSEKGPNSELDGYVPYTGKRTLLAWLIDSGTVKSSEKVQYMNCRRTRVKLEGWITRDGIHCGCCSKILTVSKFELHAGSKLRQPFQNIILESGPSLLQCLVDAWNTQEESVRQDLRIVDVDSDDPDDDTCGICGDGGDLICCDGCPSTFHQSCLGIKMLPPGDWHCPNCTCKICGTTGDTVTKEGGATANDLMICSLCEKKYHQSCSKEMIVPLVLSNNASASFCGKECQELYDHLQKITGIKHELEAGFSWSLIQRTDLETNTAHCGFPQRVECNSKLAVALSVMDECFLPIVDRRSEINLIRNVLYNCWSNFSRLNFRGFYAMILERGDEIISAASIRIHGTQLAEMPFIGTRHVYRRQGMCRRLLSTIESVLCSLKVEKLIIPAIAEHMHTWTVVFGFKPLVDSDKKEMKSVNMLVFPGTDMLQKKLMKQEIPEGTRVVESKGDCPQSPVMEIKSETDSLEKQEENMQDDAGSEHTSDIIDKADAVLSASDVPSKDVTVTNGSRNTDASQDLTEDQSPASLSTLSDIAENSVQQPEEKPTVVEIKKECYNSEGSLREAVPIEPRTSSSLSSPMQNVIDKVSTPDSAPAPVTNEDPVLRFNSDLNQPVADDVESEGGTLSGAVSDAKATNFDSGTNDQNMAEVKDEPSVASERIQTSVPSATSGGTNESSICSSPDSNQQVPSTVEAESQDAPETLSSEDSAQAKPPSNSDDSQKLNLDGNRVELSLDSFPASLDNSRAEATMP